MKKQKAFLQFLIITSLLSGFSLNAQTIVSGGIYSDTTWAFANSPFHVIDDVVVFPNVTLTIEPGVIIRFDDTKKLEIRGHLIAAGTIADSITFTSSSINPTKGSWPGIDLGGVTPGTAFFDYCIFEYADFAVDLDWGWGGNGPISISHSRFSENERGTYGYGSFTLTIDNCYFVNNGTAVSSSLTRVSNSTFINNTYGAFQMEHLSVYNSSFCGHDIALRMGQGPVKNCLIQNNNVGIEPYFPLNGIDSNIIINNNIGIKIDNGIGNGNTICNNTAYNVMNINTSAYSVSNNCWCTTNSSEIADKIYDGYDDVSLGLVTYTPFVNCDSTAIPPLSGCSINDTTSADSLTASISSTGFASGNVMVKRVQ